MAEYTLSESLYLLPTPAGAYYAVSGNREERARTFLRRLLQEESTPQLSDSLVQKLAGLGRRDALELVHRLQGMGLIQGLEQPMQPPGGSLEKLLPELLREFSDEGKALLAEQRGLYVGSAGYPHEAAVELAALSADLASITDRHQKLLQNNLGVHGNAWALVGAFGTSEVGFWPIHLGSQQLTLVLRGAPQLNRPAFVTLIWVLSRRYGQM